MEELDFGTMEPNQAVSIFKNAKLDLNLVSWEVLQKIYDAKQHNIVNDKTGRKDRTLSDGRIDKAARLAFPFEKLLVKRMAEFLFAIKVKRNYKYDSENERQSKAVKAIESVFKVARIDSVNLERAKMLYASSEVYTHWYLVKKQHQQYGFPAEYKLKCINYSPMDDVQLYPLFDEDGDMSAMAFEYYKRVGENKIGYFDIFTADQHYQYEASGDSWQVKIPGEEIIGKIPGIYLNIPEPIYYGLEDIRENIEYTVSRNSDVIAYNSAPLLKVVGELMGKEDKDDPTRYVRVEQGGDVSYISWNQSQEAVMQHISTMKSLYFMMAQLPDISAEKMMALGNIGYDARMTLFMDSHLKVGEESGLWYEGFDRETNIIKAFLLLINKNKDFSKEDMDAIEVTYEITPYMPNDKKADLEYILKANGQKPVISQEESIERANLTNDAESTYQKIKAEEETSSQESVFF